MFEYEQRYGSAVLGALINSVFHRKSELDKFLEIPGHETIGMTELAVTSVKEGWALWGLERGTERLVERLEDHLVNELKVEIVKNANVKTLKFEGASGNSKGVLDHIEVDFIPSSDSKTVEHYPCNYIISTIPAWTFAKILRKSKPSHPSLWQIFQSISGVDVIVTNVLYRNENILKEDGFGFLVPSNEVENTGGIEGLLGVVFDTCTFDQGPNTILTVMSRPTKELLDSTDDNQKEEVVRKAVLGYLETTLGIKEEPADINVTFSPQCIPQYTVGHFEKIEAARTFIKAAKIPIILAGASFDGVSVNDCIYSGRRAAEGLPF
jgi:oxygen-dependent protoporphyrinogen oxidase